MEPDIISGIVYSQFDEKLGPIAVVWIPSNLSLEKINNICLKSFNLMSAEDGLIPKSLGIIPFPSINLKGLIKSLTIKDKTRRGGAIDSAITILFKEANDVIFYKYINTFETLCNKTALKISELVETGATKKELEEEVKSLYNSITETFVEYVMKKPESAESVKSLLLLFNLFPKNLDKAINALLLGDPIFVSGDKGLIKMVIDTLRIFCIDRTPNIVYWTKEYVPGDLIGVPLAHLDEFKLGVALDLKNKKILRGTSSNFCKNLLNKARNLETSEAEEYIKERLQQILSTIEEIHKLITQKSVSIAALEPLIAELDLDDLEYIESYLKSKYPPLAKEIIKAISLCRNKISKILGGFGKEKW
jgi:hypothetical protein